MTFLFLQLLAFGFFKFIFIYLFFCRVNSTMYGLISFFICFSRIYSQTFPKLHKSSLLALMPLVSRQIHLREEFSSGVFGPGRGRGADFWPCGHGGRPLLPKEILNHSCFVLHLRFQKQQTLQIPKPFPGSEMQIQLPPAFTHCWLLSLLKSARQLVSPCPPDVQFP